MPDYESWGRYPVARQDGQRLDWMLDRLPQTEAGTTLLAQGAARSYGDVCLNDGGRLLLTENLDRFIEFDKQQGIVTCESGLTLAELLEYIVPHGWFVPVTPGTKYVSIGGMLANDVHGKNHHVEGTFGCHVLEFELLRSDGKKYRCSANENSALFSATIGGLGLTGFVNWVKFRLKPIASNMLDTETLKFTSIREFYELSSRSDRDWEYTVAWIDAVSSGKSFGRGLFMRGKHAEPGSLAGENPPLKMKKGLHIPFDFPAFVLNPLSIRAFNSLYYHKVRKDRVTGQQGFNPFFYPLDSLYNWNRIYGKRGLLQYQCVVPHENGIEIIEQLLRLCADSRLGSFLSVIKVFGDIPSPGMLSFPRSGITLALDFANVGSRLYRLLDKMDEIVVAANGAVYPAKDARMKAASFFHYYPRWDEFSQHIDERFSSGFLRRMTGE